MAQWEPPISAAAPSTPTSRNPPPPTPTTAGGYTVKEDSPRPESPGSPAPEGVHGDIELELIALANALYNLGTSTVNDNSREKPGPDGQKPDKRIGARV
jgi:mediator of RNA polymerase II transcription subunit 10